MKFLTMILVLLHSTLLFALEIGKPAPHFKLMGTLGKEISLSEFKGKIVVLEWLNHGCPFVRKHYDTKNMQSLQKKYVDQNIIWLSINSSASGKQGYVDPQGALKEKADNNSVASDILLDPKGEVGKLYGAKTTPHMFIINAAGILVYQGAIDDRPDTEKESVKGAKNYVAQALDDILAGKAVLIPSTKAYGCSVKY
jgi:peroxiredoxin